MELLSEVIRFEIVALLATLGAVVTYKLLVSYNIITGLLDTAAGELSAARVQLLITTLSGAFAYLTIVLRDPSAFSDGSQLSQLTWIAIGVGVSNVVYLGAKSYMLVFRVSR